MGYKKLKDGRYCVTARIRVDGKIVQKKSTGNYTIEQARALVEQFKKELRDSGSLKESKISTFSECLKVYIEKKNKTSGPDISRCKKLLKDLGDISLNVFPDKFENYLDLIKHDITIRGKTYSGASINRLIEIVKAAFNLCFEIGLIKKNPINSKRFPKYKEKVRDRYLTQGERLRLFNAITIQAPYLLPFIRYNMLVPCRKGELINLPKGNYDSFNKIIYIPDSKAGIPIYKPVPEEMVSYFEKIPSKCPYLFYRETKSGYKPLGDFRKAWHSCLKRAGIKDCRVHDLRHISATDLYTAGNSERMIMDIAGWKTPMLSTYRHKDGFKSA